MKFGSTTLVMAIMLSLSLNVIVDCSNAEADNQGVIEGAYSLLLTDSEGHDLSDPQYGGYVRYYFHTDTVKDPDTKEIYTLYRLAAMLSIKGMPANIRINAPGGTFMLSAKVNGMDSYLKEIGMKITVTDGEKSFVAHMMDDNVSINFAGDGNDSVLDPNKDYSVVLEPINDNYETDVPPEKVKELTMTFQAIAADGCHQVMFISQSETIESYIAFDNEVIEKVPEVSRSGYSFQGWFTPDGRQITDGYVISPNEGDIIAYAEWEKDESNNTLIYVGVGGGSALLAGALLLLLLKKKRDSEPK